MTTAKVSAKGWIVIPANLRRKYGIEPGDEVVIVDYGGVLSLVPKVDRPVQQGRGSIKAKGSLTEALLRERKRERERERRREQRGKGK
jgi:AbrB family looped-hinge helix DNA binding protein